MSGVDGALLDDHAATLLRSELEAIRTNAANAFDIELAPDIHLGFEPTPETRDCRAGVVFVYFPDLDHTVRAADVGRVTSTPIRLEQVSERVGTLATTLQEIIWDVLGHSVSFYRYPDSVYEQGGGAFFIGTLVEQTTPTQQGSIQRDI
jgi:hypothetical protein